MAGAGKQPELNRPGREQPGPGGEPGGAAFRQPQRARAQLSAALDGVDPVRQEKSLEALGRMLKTKREINGLNRRDMAVKIKIPMDQLESIEDGRLSTLPPVFAKGFLRAYANELGLDAEAILDDYRKMTGGFKNEPASREPLSSRYVETSVGSTFWRPGPRGLIFGVSVLAALAAMFVAWPGFRKSAADLWPFAAAARPTVTAGTGEMPIPTASDQAPPRPEGDAAEVGGRLDAPAPSPETPAEVGGELTLVSQKDGVWVQLAVDSRPVEHFWLKRGQTITRAAETSMTVRTGQGTALTAAWNGRDMGPLSDVPVAEINLPPS